MEPDGSLFHPPTLGFYCAAATALVVLVLAMMVITGDIPSSKGIRVSITTPRVDKPSTALPALVLQVKESGLGKRPYLLLNSTPLEWDQLRGALIQQLKLRSEWAVYVEGDPNISWQPMADAIDAVKAVNAKVILITPEMRREVAAKLKNP